MTEIEFLKDVLPDVSRLLLARYAERDRWQGVLKSDDGEMVTQVDTEAQDLIVSRIRSEFPGDRIVAEEGALRRLPDRVEERCWVVDPLDGTHNFIRGLLGAFGTSLAFVRHGEPAAAGIALPVSGNTFLAQAGGGAYLGPRRLAVSQIDTLAEANALVDFCRLAGRARALSAGGEILARAREIRGPNSAVVALCSVAAAQADLFIHPSLEPWDYAAGMLIVTEAGGAVSRLDGRPVRIFDGARDILATNGCLHAEALAAVVPT